MSRGFKNRILARLRHEASVRFQEPVVVIESDDWGLMRKPANHLLGPHGVASEWADESTESKEDLDALYHVLGQYKDAHQRPACMTANFILSNPDYEKIKAVDFNQYSSRSLKESMGEEVIAAYLKGLGEKVFFPQYHGHQHFSARPWLEDIRNNEKCAREMFEQQYSGGLSLMEGQGWRYHSEYIDWNQKKSLSAEQVSSLLEQAFDVFESVFGYRPKSTIAPHYIFTKETREAWVQKGIRYVQSANYRILQNESGEAASWSHYFGQTQDTNLCYLARTLKFEPRVSRKHQGVQSAKTRIEQLVAAGIPIVMDTHRINYSGHHRQEGLSQLQELLEFLKPYNPIYLTTEELGEAIVQGGVFQDRFSENKRELKMRKNGFSSISASMLKCMQKGFENKEGVLL